MTDLWHYLKSQTDSGRPILLYGMGNGADKIIAVCEAYGIPVADFFASDGFVRGHSFHGKVVLSFSQACEKYGTENMIVLLSFASSRPEVLETIDRVASACEMYIPDVPVCGTELFNAEFYGSHLHEINAALTLFADEESRRVYDGIIQYKLTGRMDILRATESDPADAYRNILHAEEFLTAADLGAYNGDSIRDLRQYAPRLREIIAMEPDRRNFRKLTEYATALREAGDTLTIHPVQAGAWSHTATLTFHGSGNRNAGLTDAPAEAKGNILPSTADNPYFGKTADQLSFIEAAFLAGLDHIDDGFDLWQGIRKSQIDDTSGIDDQDQPFIAVAKIFQLQLLFIRKIIIALFRLSVGIFTGNAADYVNGRLCPVFCCSCRIDPGTCRRIKR
jgi:hypothetical protein